MSHIENINSVSRGNSVLKAIQTRWEACPAVESDPERVSGSWVFRGTRVPLRALFENLKDGASINDFLEWFPGVSRAQVENVLDHELSTLNL
jgi:uncharacterized protein (DUF433 family)